jgi:thioesterase domain-containing protein
LDGRHTPHSQVEAMARHYVALLREIQPEGPYQLGGWSMGGVVAFEMAQQLRTEGEAVSLLALVDSYAPAGGEGDTDGAALHHFALDLGVPARQLPPESADPPEAQLATMLELVRQLGILSSDVTPEQFNHLFQVFQSNVRALNQYRPADYSGPGVLFKAQEAADEGRAAPDGGWAALVGDNLAVYPVPGNHYTVLRPPNVATLANRLAGLLEAVASNNAIGERGDGNRS